MTDQIDPKGKADEILNDVKTYLDHVGSKSHPIEDSVVASNAVNKVVQEMSEVWKDPQLLTAVGKEFEKVNNMTFTYLPEIDITADAGKVSKIEFSPSGWDLGARGHGLRVQGAQGGGSQPDFNYW